MHTFLLKPGSWTALGKFTDEKGKVVKATGSCVINHESEMWTNRGKMTIYSETPVTFESYYEIQPFREGSDTTFWRANNAALGKFLGKFSYTEDAITSLYHLEDRKFEGHEVVIRIDDTHYRAVGTLYHGDSKVSSWDLVLTLDGGVAC